MGVSSKVESAQNFQFPRWSAPASFAPRASSTFRRFYCSLVMVVLFAMARPTGAQDLDACIAEGKFVDGMDYFPDKVSVDHGAHWNVSYFGHYKVVTNTFAPAGAPETYVLTKCGASTPDAALFPANAKFFQIPLNTVAVDETVVATFLELLGLRTNVRYIDTTYLTSPCLNAMKGAGQVDDFAQPSDPFGGGDDALRAVQIEKVDAVIFGGTSFSDHPKAFSFSATEEFAVLSQAEWIKFLGAFFNKEKLANNIFTESATRYQCHSQATRAASETNGKYPTIAWVTHRSWKELPFIVVNTTHKQQLSRDAGGVPLVEDAHGFATAPELMAFLGDVDVVIDESYNHAGMEEVRNLYGMSDGLAKRWWRNDRITKTVVSEWGNQAGSDWFESALAEPDVVLEDLISIVHPQQQDHTRTWFRHPTEERHEPSVKCPDANEQLTLKHDGCPFSVEAGSCKGNCHKQAPSGCWCDSLCDKNGDCCDDFSTECVLDFHSCMGRCGKLPLGKPTTCFCDVACIKEGDCCHDYEKAKCHVPPSCEGVCGSILPQFSAADKEACYCDDTCEDFGDCCSDRKIVCPV